ncbi:MAG: hypothetical protein JNM68_04785, partial [Dinghuibacter sp.]|nr:hypothetical protein [Dinghuibacter sp.]
IGQYTGTSAGPQVRFTGAGSGFADVGQNSTGDFVVEQNDAARLIVTTAGNVGMGTTSPGYKLTVQDAGPVGAATISTGSYSNIITASASGAESANYYSTYTGGTVLKRWAYGKNDDAETGSNAGSDFFINRYNDAGVYLNRVMNVKRSTGYIAIGGNFIPDEQLHINGKTKTTGLQVTGGAANGFVLQSDGSGNATWVNANTLSIAETDPKVGALTNNYLSRWNGSTLTNSTVFDNGNVGIGTTVPASTLTVSGSVAASVNITAASLTLTGSDYCVIYTGGTGNTFTLPAAGTCTGRLYMIVNHGTDELAISAYRTGNATTATTISTGATLQLVSDGTEWRKIN